MCSDQGETFFSWKVEGVRGKGGREVRQEEGVGGKEGEGMDRGSDRRGTEVGEGREAEGRRGGGGSGHVRRPHVVYSVLI